MDTKNWLVIFGLLVLLLVFAFVFSMGAVNEGSSMYGILALIGFVACIGASIFNAVITRREGSSLEAWFKIYAIVAVVFLIWFLTRVGEVFN